MLIAIAGTAATVAQGKTSSTKAGAQMCVLLPDPKSSVRWETQDRPAFVAAFKAAGSTYVIDNANGDAQKQVSQAQQCIGNGAKVVILVSLDAGSSLTIEKAAKAGGAKVIEYDRQVEGGKPSIYISFDGKAVGVLQGKGVVAGLKADGMYSKKPVVAELNGGQRTTTRCSSRAATIGAQAALQERTFAKGPDQFVPDWDNQKAGTIFEQMLVKTSNKIDGVAAANDGLANAVVVALKAHKLKPIPLSGQDATAQGVQNIISGWQTMTVWKDTRLSATRPPRPRSRCSRAKPSRRPASRTASRRSSSSPSRSRSRTTSSCSTAT